MWITTFKLGGQSDKQDWQVFNGVYGNKASTNYSKDGVTFHLQLERVKGGCLFKSSVTVGTTFISSPEVEIDIKSAKNIWDKY